MGKPRSGQCHGSRVPRAFWFTVVYSEVPLDLLSDLPFFFFFFFQQSCLMANLLEAAWNKQTGLFLGTSPQDKDRCLDEGINNL